MPFVEREPPPQKPKPKTSTPTPTKSFGAEMRLGSGQYARVNPGGIVEVLPEPEPDTFYYRMNLEHKDITTPTFALAEKYTDLIKFLAQMETLEYTLINIERLKAPKQ
jgi:hypothetical protein